MSEKVQRKRLAAVRTLEQAWSEKQEDWLPKLLWAVEIRVDGDPDQLKGARDWHSGVLSKLGKMAELTPGDPASAHQYLREASQHHAISWDEEPTAVGISVHKLLEVLRRAHRLQVVARRTSSENSTIAPDLGQERPARPRRSIGSLAFKGLECSDVDDEEPPMLPRQGIKRELSEGGHESIIVTGAGPNKRVRADPQPSPQPDPQPEAQREGYSKAQPGVQPAGEPAVQPGAQPGAPLGTQLGTQPAGEPGTQPAGEPEAEPERLTNGIYRFRLGLEEAERAAKLAAAKFDMLEKEYQFQRLKLQLSS